jgi:hypothetical protein
MVLEYVLDISVTSFFPTLFFQFSAQNHPRSSESQGSTLLHRLFHHSPSNAYDTSPSSPLKWAQALLKRREQSSEGTELQGRSQVVEVPYAKGKRVSSFFLSCVQLHLISCREMLARERSGKQNHYARRLPLRATHDFPSPMSLSNPQQQLRLTHPRNRSQLTPPRPPHLPSVNLL